MVFTVLQIGPNWGPISLFGRTELFGYKIVEICRHLLAIGYKFILMFPIAGISYELIKNI